MVGERDQEPVEVGEVADLAEGADVTVTYVCKYAE